MTAKYSRGTRKHRSPRRARISRNHHRNRSRAMEHRTHEWMASVARKFSFLDDCTFSDLTVSSCTVTPFLRTLPLISLSTIQLRAKPHRSSLQGKVQLRRIGHRSTRRFPHLHLQLRKFLPRRWTTGVVPSLRKTMVRGRRRRGARMKERTLFPRKRYSIHHPAQVITIPRVNLSLQRTEVGARG